MLMHVMCVSFYCVQLYKTFFLFLTIFIQDYVSVLSRPMATTNESLNPVWTGVYRDASVS